MMIIIIIIIIIVIMNDNYYNCEIDLSSHSCNTELLYFLVYKGNLLSLKNHSKKLTLTCTLSCSLPVTCLFAERREILFLEEQLLELQVLHCLPVKLISLKFISLLLLNQGSQ